jgi:hypothetical protein
MDADKKFGSVQIETMTEPFMRRIMEPIDREHRLRLAKLVAKEIVKRDQNRILNQKQTQTKEEAGMPIFWISEDESKQLDNMTVRALADNPEATRAFFDQYGVFLTNEEKIVGAMDYTIVGNPTVPTIYDESLSGDPFMAISATE